MMGKTLKHGTGKELKNLLTLLTGTVGESLGSLVGSAVAVRPLELELKDSATLLENLAKPGIIAQGTMSKGLPGKPMLAMFDVADAATMAGMLMMTSPDVVAQRRTQATLGSEDAEAFGQLGTALFAGLDGVLREHVGEVELRYQKHGAVQPKLDKDGILGSEPLILFGFALKIGDHPESTGMFAIDAATADAWNKAPLEWVDKSPGASADAASAASRADEDGLESVPAAPIRGTLAAYLVLPDMMRTLRRVCRRVGFELKKHGRGEIPNPAAHRNEVVLLEAAAGDDRRFEWCRRIKDIAASTKVVLLVHLPSRQRVTQAFLSKADAIIGAPCEESLLAQKLGALLPNGPPTTPDAPPAPTPAGPDAPAAS